MKEEGQQLKQIIADVVVGFLQAQDPWREEGLVLVYRQHILTIPREEAELKQVFDHHHDLWETHQPRDTHFSY